MPCRTCKDKMKIEGNFKMRFKCDPNGKLLKGAPGNYKCGQIYLQPFRMSKFAFWELVEPTPELKVPSAGQGDSVFEDTVFVPDDDVATVTLQPTPVIPENVNTNPDAPAIVEPYGRWSATTGRITPYTSTDLPIKPDETPVVVQEVQKEKSREELLAILDSQKIEVPPKTRTTTLVKMVEELEAEEKQPPA